MYYAYCPFPVPYSKDLLQGSILGPLLFPDVVSSAVKSFPGDTNLASVMHSDETSIYTRDMVHFLANDIE